MYYSLGFLPPFKPNHYANNLSVRLLIKSVHRTALLVLLTLLLLLRPLLLLLLLRQLLLLLLLGL